MISLATAMRLKAAGLRWQPAVNDFFAIPERGMDDKLFVISDIHATVERLQGRTVIAFQGASEWALDNLVLDEAIWMPGEAQLRMALQAELIASGRPEVSLAGGLEGWRCTIHWQGEARTFAHPDASEAYAAALLFIIHS